MGNNIKMLQKECNIHLSKIRFDIVSESLWNKMKMLNRWKFSCKHCCFQRLFKSSWNTHFLHGYVEGWSNRFKIKLKATNSEESGFDPRSSEVSFFQMDNSRQVQIKATGSVAFQRSQQDDVNPSDGMNLMCWIEGMQRVLENEGNL